MKFGLFYTKTLKKSKTAITFAYDVEKKRIIYQTEEHDEESSISTPQAVLAIFRILNIEKEKKLQPKLKKFRFFYFFCDFESQSLNLWSKCGQNIFFEFFEISSENMVKIVKLWSKQSKYGQNSQTVVKIVKMWSKQSNCGQNSQTMVKLFFWFFLNF